MIFSRRLLTPAVLCLVLGVAAGSLLRDVLPAVHGEPRNGSAPGREGARLVPESRAAFDPNWERDYPQYQPVGKVLQPYPGVKPGEMCPQDLSVYGGAGRTSYASV